jgi:hypothetical protein
MEDYIFCLEFPNERLMPGAVVLFDHHGGVTPQAVVNLEQRLRKCHLLKMTFAT